MPEKLLRSCERCGGALVKLKWATQPRRFCSTECYRRHRLEVPIVDRFLASVEKRPSCWVWTGGVLKSGYGQTRVSGRFARAHRLAWTIFRGPIPANTMVLHACDVRRCVNPDHLFLGTNADNMADMRLKRRQGRRAMPTPPKPLAIDRRRGPQSHNAKLTEDDVREIRASADRQATLAIRYGVNRTTIRKILRWLMWQHVT